MTETYEQLRDAASGDAGQAWRNADREESNLRALYRSLKEDPRYTQEHKAQKAWENYETARERIVAGREKARESLKKQAQTAERLSIPLPDGEALITTDTSKLLAAQNEAARIIRKLERASLASPARGPFKPTPLEVLKEEYASGLEIGGMQGGVICRGVLMAADELGADTGAVVDGFRKQRHRKSLESAHHAQRLAFTIGGKAPEPPFPRPGSAQAARLRRGGPAPILVPRPQAQQVVEGPVHGASQKPKGKPRGTSKGSPDAA
jgi:hypothetical protein